MSTEPIPEWFEWDDALPPFEEEFLAALRERAQQWPGLGLQADHTMVFMEEAMLVIGVDISDPDFNSILRTLRADLYPDKVICGHDPTYQFVGVLDPACSDYVVHPATEPRALAELAASWFESELRRPIERHEWMIGNGHHVEWKDLSTDSYFLRRGSTNTKRTALGPPQRRVVVRDFRLEGKTDPEATVTSSLQPWFTWRSWVCVSLVGAMVGALGLSFWGSGRSYAAWAFGGIAYAFLMVLGSVVGLVVLIAELKHRNGDAIVWPVLLLFMSLLPLLLILLVGSVLDF